MSRHWRTHAATAAIFMFSVTISVVAVEVLLRWFVFDPTVSYIRTPGWAMQVRVDDKLPGVSGGHLLQINRLGLRGDLPTLWAQRNIAVLGGSTVEDWVLSDDETWVARLHERLSDCRSGVWTANLGKAGTNARHHLIQLPAVSGYMPRFDYLVVLMGLNDFLFDLRIHHPFILPERWWQDQALMYQAGQEGAFALVALAHRLLTLFSAEQSAVPLSDFGAYMEALWAAHDAVKPAQWVAEMPDLSDHLASYRSTILMLKHYADDYGAEIVFLTQPYVWSESMSQQARDQIYAGFIGADMSAETTRWYTADALRQGLSAYNRVLLDVCAEEGLHCIDLAGQLGHHATDFYDDFHFSEAGATRVAARVADGLRQLPGLCD